MVTAVLSNKLATGKRGVGNDEGELRAYGMGMGGWGCGTECSGGALLEWGWRVGDGVAGLAETWAGRERERLPLICSSV